MDTEVVIVTNKDAFKEAAAESIQAALETIGLDAVGNAQEIITAEGRVDTGALRNSIAYNVEAEEKAVYIGSNLEYAIYNEVGTGIYTEGGGGRKTGWVYEDSHGETHFTHGMKPIHFLKRATSENSDRYKQIVESILKS